MERAYRKRIFTFFLRGFVVWLVWYVLYDLWLEPQGTFDHTLSHNLVSVSGDILSFFGFKTFVSDRVVGLTGMPGIIIITPCDGMEAMGLFLGFIHAFPGNRWRRWLFSLAGLLVIYLTNIVRIIVLVLTQRYWPGVFDFTHHYSTTALFYVIVFLLWVIWAHWGIRDAIFSRSVRSASLQEKGEVV